MKEIFDVWRKPRLLVLASYTAAIYAAVLIPFKYGLPLVPGSTEIRPGVAVLFLCSFLFGPAAAWGGAFGNLIGDFFGGTLGVGSVFGFFGNFFLAYLPYRTWEMLKGGHPAPVANPFWWFKYLISVALGTAACAGIIAWGIDWAFGVPFVILCDIIFVNNMIMAIALAPLLLAVIAPRMEAWGYTYRQMDTSRRDAAPISFFGLAITSFSAGALMIVGNVLSSESWTKAASEIVSMPKLFLDNRIAALAPIVLLLFIGTLIMSANRAAAHLERKPDAESEEKTGDENIVIKNLKFTYDGSDLAAIDFEGDSLEIEAGKFVVVMGKTGAGKTTLARCLTGAAPNFYPGEYRGTVSVPGASPMTRDPAGNAHAVGMVFEDFESQLFSTNVELEVAFGPENLGAPQNQIASAIEYSLREVGLAGIENRDPASLSGGEKQRLAIAATLAMDAPMLILDEPTTDLDPIGKADLYYVLDKLSHRKKTILLIEHEADAAEHADEILLMSAGKISAKGSPQTILSNAALLESHGVKPSDSVKLLSSLGFKKPPSSTDAAVEVLKNNGIKIDEKIFANLIESEAARNKSYGEELIRLDGLEHAYNRERKSLKGVSLSIRKGEFIAILGHNGSGKTTLAKHLNGLLKPISGKVFLEGKSVAGLPLSQVARKVGYVFQNPDHQIFNPTVVLEVSFAPKNFGLSKEEIDSRVRAALEATGLAGREDSDPFHMTKGERQRVAVAGVLAGAPEIIILDEPTTGLDLDEQRSIMELLKKLNREGHTIIIVTHAVWVAAQYSHRAVLMADGNILADGATREVFHKEDALSKAKVKPPQITDIGKKTFGKVFLSVAEMLDCIGRGNR